MRACLVCRSSLRSFSKQMLVAMSVLFAASFFFVEKINAQEKTTVQNASVKGRVTDESGSPLPGVSVQLKGTSTGAVTNTNGEYSIKISGKANPVLVFSSAGLTEQEIAVRNRSEIQVTLTPQVKEQEEVVVVGYGTQKRQAVTGAVVRADLKTYEKVPVNNIMETLKGTVAGLNVGEANRAGSVPGFTIRGANTIAASSSPLIVVDGVIFNGSLADISPADVESATILKDASAAAVFGSRSASGVILIETKKGGSVNGKPKFQVQASYGTVSEISRLKVYDAPGYMKRLNDILNDNGTVVAMDQTPNYLQVIEKTNYDATPDHQPTLTNPYSLFSRTGKSINTTASVSQRTDKMSYYLAATYVDQKGVIINDDFKRYGLRLNLESKITNWLTLGIRSSYSFRDYPGSRIYGAANNGSSATLFSPYASAYNADGSYNMFPQTTTSFVNPFSMMATEAYDRTNNFNGILTGTVKVPWVKGLTYTMNYSKMINLRETGSFFGFNTQPGLTARGTGSRNYSRGTSTLLDQIIKYNKTFAGVHNVDVTLLHSETKTDSYGQGASASGFDNDQLGTYRLSAGAIQNTSTSGSRTEGIGQMARVTYTYDNKYSVTGTIRHDGYSAFSANKKYGDFSSVGVNWNVTQEKFMKKVPVINSLAIRASYGTNGNQSIDPYSTLSKISNGYYIYQGDANYSYTQNVSGLGNDDLVWESTTGLNAGIDFELFKSRISGSIDGYFTRTNNLAFTLNLPLISGFTSITANAGEIQNRGVEINLRTVNMKRGDFTWRTEAAFSLNRNKIARLLGDKDGDGKEDDIVSSGLFIGKSLSEIYTYKVTGMWQQSDKDNGTIMAGGYQPGHYKYLDVNHDGKITSDSDRVFLGNGNANFRWSLTNTFSYKGFTLLVYANSIWGGNGWFMNGGNTPWNDGYANVGSMNHPIYDYWTPTNTGAEFPRPSFKDRGVVRTAKYYDRSFIRLQKVALSYELTKFVEKYGIQGLNVAISGDNLGTYAPHWIGLDAATGSGLTVSSIPSLRTINMNINLNF